jgi:hypothetical protein
MSDLGPGGHFSLACGDPPEPPASLSSLCALNCDYCVRRSRDRGGPTWNPRRQFRNYLPTHARRELRGMRRVREHPRPRRAGRPRSARRRRASSSKCEIDAKKSAQKMGQVQPFIAAFPQECMSKTGIFWVDQASLSLPIRDGRTTSRTTAPAARPPTRTGSRRRRTRSAHGEAPGAMGPRCMSCRSVLYTNKSLRARGSKCRC